MGHYRCEQTILTLTQVTVVNIDCLLLLNDEGKMFLCTQENIYDCQSPQALHSFFFKFELILNITFNCYSIVSAVKMLAGQF